MNFQNVTSAGLARILVQESDQQLWDEEELGSILRHQLDALLVVDLGEVSTDGSAVPAESFAELFAAQNPDVELLKLVKRFAKGQIGSNEPSVPSDVARVLYYTAIFIAYDRYGTRISQLVHDQIRSGLEWALSRPWLDPRLRDTFVSGLSALPRE